MLPLPGSQAESAPLSHILEATSSAHSLLLLPPHLTPNKHLEPLPLGRSTHLLCAQSSGEPRLAPQDSFCTIGSEDGREAAPKSPLQRTSPSTFCLEDGDALSLRKALSLPSGYLTSSGLRVPPPLLWILLSPTMPSTRDHCLSTMKGHAFK
jgi:hypothetical protein